MELCKVTQLLRSERYSVCCSDVMWYQSFSLGVWFLLMWFSVCSLCSCWFFFFTSSPAVLFLLFYFVLFLMCPSLFVLSPPLWLSAHPCMFSPMSCSSSLLLCVPLSLCQFVVHVPGLPCFALCSLCCLLLLLAFIFCLNSFGFDSHVLDWHPVFDPCLPLLVFSQ